jgi:Holliday junction resolvase
MLRAITEREWQKTVTELLTQYGWAWWHGADNRPVNGRIQNIRPGLPDLIAVRGARVIFIELKRETGKPTPEQVDALIKLDEAAEAYLWRPSDFETALATLKPEWAGGRNRSEDPSPREKVPAFRPTV